jgi:hypothetical protein
MPLTGFVCQKNVKDQNGHYVGELYIRIETPPSGWCFRPASQSGPPDDSDFTHTATDAEAEAACDKFLSDSGYTGDAWGCPTGHVLPSKKKTP